MLNHKSRLQWKGLENCVSQQSMPNLISVTSTGPNILSGFQKAVAPVVGDVRKAGAILKGNPMSAALTELIFPEPVADGTLEAAFKREGRY